MKKSGINRQSYKPSFTTINNMRWGKPSCMVSYDNYKKNINFLKIAVEIENRNQFIEEIKKVI